MIKLALTKEYFTHECSAVKSRLDLQHKELKNERKQDIFPEMYSGMYCLNIADCVVYIHF